MPKKNLSEHIIHDFARQLLFTNVRATFSEMPAVLRMLSYFARQNVNLPDNYTQHMESEAWQESRRMFLKLMPACVACGSSQELHVHHLSYDYFGSESSGDCVVLCLRCHACVHQDGGMPLQWALKHCGCVIRDVSLSLMCYGVDFIPYEIAELYSFAKIDSYPTPVNDSLGGEE